MKLTKLKNSEVLPQRIEMNDVAVTCNKKCVDIGVNKTVSSLEKVELVMNEEKIIEILSNKQDYEQIPLLTRIKIAKTLIQSQHLFLSLRRSE